MVMILRQASGSHPFLHSSIEKDDIMYRGVHNEVGTSSLDLPMYLPLLFRSYLFRSYSPRLIVVAFLFAGCSAKDVAKPVEDPKIDLVNEDVDCATKEPLSGPTIVGGSTQDTDRISFGVRASFRSSEIADMVVERGGQSDGSVPITAGIPACYAVDLPENQTSEITVYGRDNDGCATEKTTFSVTHSGTIANPDTMVVPETTGRNIASIAKVELANGRIVSGSIESLSNPVGDDAVTMSVSDWAPWRNDVKIFYNFNHINSDGIVDDAFNALGTVLGGDPPTHNVRSVRIHWSTPPGSGSDVRIYVSDQVKKPDVAKRRFGKPWKGAVTDGSVPDNWVIAGQTNVEGDAVITDIPLDGNASAIRFLFVSLARTATGSFNDTFSLTEVELLAPSIAGIAAGAQSGCLR